MLDNIKLPYIRYDAPVVNGKGLYKRILIKKNDSLEPIEFEIIKFRKGDDDKDLSYNGNTPYFRILIKRKQ